MEKIKTWLRAGDLRLLYYLNHQIRSRVLDRWMNKITHLGGAWFTIIISILLIPTKAGMEAPAALASSHLLVHALKKGFGRERPYLSCRDLYVVDQPLEDHSFPSGHSTAIFSVVTVLALLLPWLAMIVYPLALTVGMSRIYLGLHYPSDVIAGAAIGATFAECAHLLIS